MKKTILTLLVLLGLMSCESAISNNDSQDVNVEMQNGGSGGTSGQGTGTGGTTQKPAGG